MSKRPHMSIDLATKLQILEEVDCGILSKTKIAEKYRIPKSTLSTIIMHRNKINEAAASGSTPGSVKRMRKAKHENLESDLLEWFNYMSSCDTPLDGPLVQEKAKELSVKHGIQDFKCSSGWLWRFKKRHSIRIRGVCSELNNINEAGVNSWLEDFEQVRKNYAPCDIFNVDETGLFYNLLPDHILTFEDQKYLGGEGSKQRLTIVLACNSDGSEKLKAWVIGKSNQPRCLKPFDLEQLPCKYSHNRKAWIDSVAFREWLKDFDTYMATQNRNVLLTLDNCAAHKVNGLKLSNVKVHFFPADITRRVQPLGQGIISNMKKVYQLCLYRAAIIALAINVQKPKWNVLDAMRAVALAWDTVTPEIIQRCFRKAWSLSNDNDSNDTNGTEIHGDEPAMWGLPESISTAQGSLRLSDYQRMDESIAVCEPPNDVQYSEDPSVEPVTQLSCESEEEEEEEEEEIESPKRNDVMAAVAVLERLSATSDVSQNFIKSLEVISFECAMHFNPKDISVEYNADTV